MKSNLSLANLPDSLKPDVSLIADARDVEQLSLFIDNTAAELEIGNSMSNGKSPETDWNGVPNQTSKIGADLIARLAGQKNRTRPTLGCCFAQQGITGVEGRW
mgnify:CR=1 FL=1